jgi:hypothetical protein
MASPQPRPELTQPDDPSIRLIPLTKGQVAIVDTDRYEWASQWKWHAHYGHGAYYAVRKTRRAEPKKYLHRQLLGEPDGEVDHINGNTLDCRMQNLRTCTRSQNNANRSPLKNNTSGYPGVYRYGDHWEARIYLGHKIIHLGHFATKEEAIAARKAGEVRHYGEFAYSARPSNLPPKKPPVGDHGAAHKSHNPIVAA